LQRAVVSLVIRVVKLCLLTGLTAGGAGAPASVTAAAAAPQYVEVRIGLRWRNAAALESLLRDLADPSSPRFERYLSRTTFLEQFAPTHQTIDAAAVILAQQGLRLASVSPSRLFLKAEGYVNDVSLARAELLKHLRELLAEERLYFHVLAGDGAGAAAGDTSVDLHAPEEAAQLSPQVVSVYWPSDIAQMYGFDQLYQRGLRGEAARNATIAIATAFAFDRSDLRRFWSASAIDRSDEQVELIWVGTPSTQTHAETDADVQWASSLAPGSPVLVYAAPDTSADSFLQVYDRIVNDNRAAILTTSWGACERRLSNTYLEQAHIIFQRAAAQGITILAASGDNGADDCRDGRLGVSFPASDPNVLATGGTSADGIAESAWPGSGGGVSEKWPAPPWQMRPEANRVLADVAFHADPARGFATSVGRRTRVFGGTSLAAPCWAALIALSNQLRMQRHRPSLGVAAPALCQIANSDSGPGAFRDIISGDNGGFDAGPGWDFPTGWGSPRALDLAESLAGWSAPTLDSADLKRSLLLTPMRSDTGSVRVQFLHRCAATELRLSARNLDAGRYDFELGNQPVASFTVDGGGNATVKLTGADPRGQRVSVTRNDGEKVFTGNYSHRAALPLQVKLEMDASGVLPAASAKAVYRRSPTRERFAVHARGLPPGTYGVRFGATTTAWFTVPPDRNRGRVRFDSSGRNGEPLLLNPLCDSVTITLKGNPILRAARVSRDPSCA
jgi:kumamolisin